MSSPREAIKHDERSGPLAVIPKQAEIWQWLVGLFIWVSYSLMGMLVYYGAVGITHLYPSPPESITGIAVGVLAFLSGPVALAGHLAITGILLYWTANALARIAEESLEVTGDV